MTSRIDSNHSIPLIMPIAPITEKVTPEPKIPLDHDLERRVLEAFRSSHKTPILKEFPKLLPGELEQVLMQYADELSTAANPTANFDLDAMMKKLDKLGSRISIKQLQDAILSKIPSASKDPNSADMLTARKMFQEAKLYLDKTENKVSATTKSILHKLLDAILAFFDSLFAIFGVADVFRSTQNQMEAQLKMGKVMMLASLFMMLMGTLSPLLGAETTGMIVGGSMISLAVLSLIYPKIRPRTRELPEAINLTKEIQEGRHTTVGGRKDAVQKIGRIFSTNSKKICSHAMLLGRSGVGKTQTVHAFVQAIERGEFPELKGKTVFYYNMADIVNSSDFLKGGNQLLAKISELMGQYRDQIILIFDEIHLACQVRENSMVGDQLKKYLDPQNTNNYPYVIGMTTELEFYRDIYKNNPAVARRFERIVIENTTEMETLGILNSYILQEAPKILLEKGILSTLLVEAHRENPNAVQPGYALKILADCTKYLSSLDKSAKARKIEQVKSDLESLYAQGAVDPLDHEHARRVTDLETSLAKLEDQLRVETLGLQRLKKLQDDLLRLKNSMNRNIVKVAQKNAEQSKLMKHVLLQRYFAIPALEAAIKAQATRIGRKVTLDQALIAQVIREDRENEQRVAAIVESGRLEIQSRQAGPQPVLMSAANARQESIAHETSVPTTRVPEIRASEAGTLNIRVSETMSLTA